MKFYLSLNLQRVFTLPILILTSQPKKNGQRVRGAVKSVVQMYLQFNYPNKKKQHAKVLPTKSTPLLAKVPAHSWKVRKYKTRQFSATSRCSTCQSAVRTSQTTDEGSTAKTKEVGYVGFTRWEKQGNVPAETVGSWRAWVSYGQVPWDERMVPTSVGSCLGPKTKKRK